MNDILDESLFLNDFELDDFALIQELLWNDDDELISNNENSSTTTFENNSVADNLSDTQSTCSQPFISDFPPSKRARTNDNISNDGITSSNYENNFPPFIDPFCTQNEILVFSPNPQRSQSSKPTLLSPNNIPILSPAPPAPKINKDEALLKLFTIPQQFQRCINMGDFIALQRMLDESFASDCAFKNSAMKKEVRGIANIMEIYKSIVATFPDFMLVVKKAKFCHKKGTITASVHSSGTKCLDDAKETSYNLVKSNPDHRITPTLLRKANDIMKSGKRFKCLSHSIWNLALNAEHNKVIKFQTIQNIVNISEA